jgi:hypothetical protein
VLHKRIDQSDEVETLAKSTNNGLATAETARSSAESSAPGKPENTGDDNQISLFWRVFGGTILSMVALGAITLYNSISTSIAELRNELNREREARAELVKKDEFNSRTTSQYERIHSFEGLKADLEGLKERANASNACLEGLKKDVAATSDVAKKDGASLEVLKEKLGNALADLKSTHDGLMKIQQEQERNRAADLERKNNHDAQYKQVEETLKELQRGLQDCREKLARIEGMQPMGPARGGFFPFETPATPVRTLPPAESKGMGNTSGAGAGKPNPSENANPSTSKPGPTEEPKEGM